MLGLLRSEMPYVAALFACCLGALASLHGAAPVSRLSLHVAAAAFGLSGYALLRRRLGRGDFRRDLVVLLFASAMLALTLAVAMADHIEPWLATTGVSVHSSELFAPLLLVIAAGLFAREHVLAGGAILLLVAFVQFLAPDLELAIAWACGASALLAARDRWTSTQTGLVIALALLVAATWLRLPTTEESGPMVLTQVSLGALIALACLGLVASLLTITAFGLAPALVGVGTRASKLAGLALSAYFVVDLSSALGALHVTLLSPSPLLGAFVGLAALFAQARAERRLRSSTAE